MTFSNGLLVECERLDTTLDAPEDDRGLFNLDPVKSRILNEEHREEVRDGNTTESALLTTPQSQRFSGTPLICSHYKQWNIASQVARTNISLYVRAATP